MKKIFDVNALDLAKVGKSFGFAVPPRVNLNLIGGGKGNTGGGTVNKSAHKRARAADDDDEDDAVLEEMEVGGGADDVEADEGDIRERVQGRQQNSGKKRRVETLGQRKVDREVYKKEKDRRHLQSGSTNWSR